MADQDSGDEPSEQAADASSGRATDARKANMILLGLGSAVALTAGSSINQIETPTLRAIFALGALVIVFGLGLHARAPWQR